MGNVRLKVWPRPGAFYAGLFLVALSTLVLEVVTTRVLSVLTWYHLAFLAISLAMLGLTAGAVVTYLRPGSFSPDRLEGTLVRSTLLFAASLAGSHLLLLVLRVPTELGGDALSLLTVVVVSVTLAVPFYFAGVVIAAALTRVALPLGRVYAADLLGAGLGCLAAIPLLDRLDPTSALLLTAAVAALAAPLFAAAGGRRRPALLALALLFAAFAFANRAAYPTLLRVEVMKGRPLPRPLALDRWNSHSRVTARPPRPGPPTYWGAGTAPLPAVRVRQMPLRIDGGAFTVATGFDGEVDRLGWIAHDLTSLAYHLRGRGEVAVVGVGGGRDLLTALAFGARRVTGVEINRIFLDLLEGELRGFAGLAGRPEVELVHAEGRSFLAASEERYDLVQMALVDTWASTTAGAMTLSENGLYTVEAWRLFLDRLTPEGVLTVSRWYAPERPGEAARLLSLAVAALLGEGVEEPSRHLALAGAGRLSTLVVGRSPLDGRDQALLEEAAARYGFRLLLLPGRPPDDELLGRIAAAATPEALARATAHPLFDLSPPKDDRPFFFNMLKPGLWPGREALDEVGGGVLEGNLRAAETLAAILTAVSILVLATIVGPLLALGRRHGLAPGRFAAAAGYFSLIGAGFMLVEIALIQRFSPLLGHPIYSLAVTLMSLVVATGVGSALSDGLALSSRRGVAVIPLAAAAAVAVTAWGVGPLCRWATAAPLAGRVAVVLVATAPLGLVLGLPFPSGMRLLRRRSVAAMSWMWGLNGGFGVLGSVVAVVLSMTWGIRACLLLGGAAYLLLLLPALLLWRDKMEVG